MILWPEKDALFYVPKISNIWVKDDYLDKIKKKIEDLKSELQPKYIYAPYAVECV